MRPGWCGGRVSSRSTDRKPNFSRRIGPYLSDGLGNDQIFPAVRRDRTGRPAVSRPARRRARRHVVGRRADRRNRDPADRSSSRMSRLLADRAYRVGQLREWLAAAPAYGALTAEDIETLSNDPPLPFFILFEAMQQPQAEGLRLGPLGSIIVSEVIFGALAGDPRSSERRLARRVSLPICRANITRQILSRKFPKFEHGSAGRVHRRNRRAAAGRARIPVKRNFSASRNPEE